MILEWIFCFQTPQSSGVGETTCVSCLCSVSKIGRDFNDINFFPI